MDHLDMDAADLDREAKKSSTGVGLAVAVVLAAAVLIPLAVWAGMAWQDAHRAPSVCRPMVSMDGRVERREG